MSEPEKPIRLLACPFCGETGFFATYGISRAVVRCSGCLAQTDDEPTTEEAAANWNRRPSPAASVESGAAGALGEGEPMACPREWDTGIRHDVRLESVVQVSGRKGVYVLCSCGWFGPVADEREEAIRLWNLRAAPEPELVDDPLMSVTADLGTLRDKFAALEARLAVIERIGGWGRGAGAGERGEPEG